MRWGVGDKDGQERPRTISYKPNRSFKHKASDRNSATTPGVPAPPGTVELRTPLYFARMSTTIGRLSVLLGVLSLSSCGPSPSEKIMDEFNRANEALTDTVLASADKLDAKYEHLRAMACAEGRMLANSVSMLYERASERMFALDETLTGPSLADGQPASDAFAPNGVASEALNAALALYGSMESMSTDDSTKRVIVAAAQPFRTAGDVNAWYERDFRQAPAPAITALAERYVADMGRTKRRCIADLLKPCGGR